MAEMYSLIVVKYPRRDTADAALTTIRDLASKKVVTLKDAVAITKSDEGKIRLHQSKDDTAGRGFLKGGAIGILFALLFGGAGWLVAGALAGTALGMFDRGIKNSLLKELGENMDTDESALAVLIEEADWTTLRAHMDAHYSGKVIMSALVNEKLEHIEQLTADQRMLDAVPEELDLTDTSQE